MLDLKQNAASKLLTDQGVTKESVLRALKDVRGSQRVTDQNPEDKFQPLEKFGRDLNELARKGKLDPVIGREEEIRRVLQVLSRRTKNNPVLIGEPGVGKTAIAEGLAHRIIQGDVPENLKTKRIIALDMAAMIAGASFRGQFEERMKAVLKEVEDSHGSIILFIDELHTLVGAGAAQGAVDASNMLKPALARGDLRAIGATTLDEYRKYIEKDPALERRFQPILIDEPNVEDTISILRGLNDRYEVHHGVRITDAAIVAAAQLSYRYISDRFLPDKAIDLIDEAAAKLRIEIDSMPEELDVLERKVKQLEIENEAVKRELTAEYADDSDKAAIAGHLQQIKHDLAELNQKRSELKAHWQVEKDLIQSIRSMKAEIEQVRIEADKKEREGDLGKVAELRYGVLTNLDKKIKAATVKLSDVQKDHKMLKEEVDAEDIAEIVSKWTGIPVTRMLESELYETPPSRGQDSRTDGQSGRGGESRCRCHPAEPRRPSGRKEADRFLHFSRHHRRRKDRACAIACGSSVQRRGGHRPHRHERVHGKIFSLAPDRRTAGVRRLRRRRAAHRSGAPQTWTLVLLLDEIEKAHPEVFNVLLQLLDDGRLTDSKGRTVNFKNTIVIMTSNLGSQLIQEKISGTETDEDWANIHGELRAELFEMLRQSIRPEFLNRVDEIILFKPLSRSDIKKVVDLQLHRVAALLAKKEMKLSVTEEAKEWLAKLGYDPSFGARPLKRVIQKHIVNALSERILAGDFSDRDSVEIVLDREGVIGFRKLKQSA